MIRSNPIMLALLGLVIFCSWNPSPLKAQKTDEKTYTVRYSYEKQNRTGQKRYVLIPVPIKVDSQAYTQFKDRQRALFQEIKKAKSKTYGKTKFNANTEKKTVSIFLDPEKLRNFKIILAEAVYTFTENGAEGVLFPKSKYSGRTYTRLDVQNAAYQLTLPYWEGLPPRNVKGALLSFPDGSLVNSTVLGEQVQKSDSKLVSFLNQTLKSGDVNAIEAVIKATETSTIKGIEEGLLPLLKSASKDLRLLALRGLKGRDQKQVNQSIREVMDEDPEDQVRLQASLHLAQSKDNKYAEAARFYGLQSKDPKVVIEAINALSKAKSKEVTPKMIAMLKSKESTVRQALLKTLAQRSAHKDLLKAMDGELSVEIKVEIAQSLLESSKHRNEAFKFLVTQPKATPAIQAVQKLGKDKKNKKALSLLEKALSHPDLEVIEATSKALVDFGGLKALAVLKKGDLTDPKREVYLHQAMRFIFQTQSSKTVFKTIGKSKNNFEKSAAVGALGYLYSNTKEKRTPKQVMKELNKAIASDDALVRAEAVRSLGDIRAKESKTEQIDQVRELILSLVKDKSSRVRSQFAYSIQFFEAKVAQPHLAEYLKEKEVDVLENTIRTVGTLKLIELTTTLLDKKAYVKNPEVKIRRVSTQTLGLLAGILVKGEATDKSKAQILNIMNFLEEAIDKDQDVKVRVNAILGLGQIPSKDSNFILNTRAQAGKTQERVAVIEAAVLHGNQSAISILESAMGNDKDAFVRRKAYEAVSAFKKVKDLSNLKKILGRQLKIEKDPELKALIEKQLKNL